jgi:hypothetical protein
LHAGRTSVLHICLSAVRRAGASTDELIERVWVGVDGLLEEAVEEHASGLGGAAVEPEGELVEVVGQVLAAGPVVQGAGGPALEQGGDQVRSGHHRIEICRGVARRGQVRVAVLDQAGEHPCAVSADGGAGSHDVTGEVDHVQAAGLVGELQADPAEPAAVVAFDGDGDRRLVGGRPSFALGPSAQEALVELDHPGQQLAVGADHGPAQLVQPGPRGLIRAKAEGVLQALSGDPVLL